jgi:hypothetical protein
MEQIGRTGKVPDLNDNLVDIERRNKVLRELDDSEGW